MTALTPRQGRDAPATRPLRPGRRGFLVPVAVGVVLAISLLIGPMVASAQEKGAVEEMELTTPIRLELRRIQDSWQDWTRAYFQDNEEQARHSLSQLLTAAEKLGMEKLPDQSIASAAFAVRSALEGNHSRARWAVECARELDPGRPEADFASATVERLAGNYFGIVTENTQGFVKLMKLPLEGHIWRQNLGLSFLYILAFAGGLHLVLLMAARGADLFHDLGRLVSPPLPRVGADAFALMALLWPLVLPSGVLWLAIYWSILLWGYASWSQRGILVFTGLAIGLSPAAMALHQQEVEGALTPPRRVIENLSARRLYGSLFQDLEVLRNLQPESPIVTELTADLHRDLGQWEYARATYLELHKANPESSEVASAINNVGVYHFRRGEFGTAIPYFKNATEVDGNMTEAWYNLARAFAEDLKFGEDHGPMARAKSLDSEKVARWEKASDGQEKDIVATYGGLGKARQFLRVIDDASRRRPSRAELASQAYLSLATALAAMILAVGLHLARQRRGYPSNKFTGDSELPGQRYLAALLPGWESTRQGRGIAAFLMALIFSALVCLPFLTQGVYRIFLGADSGPTLAQVTCVVFLVLFFVLRLGQAVRG